MKSIKIGRRRVRRSWLVIAALFGILAGLGMASYGYHLGPTLSILSVVLAPISLLRRPGGLVFALLAGIALGSWRGNIVYANLQQYTHYFSSEVTVAGRVSDDPSYHESGQLEFFLERPMIDGVELPGKIRVRGFTGALAIRRGDLVEVEGKMRPGFGSYKGSISYSAVEVIERNQSMVERFRRQFFTGVYNALPEPQASLGLGFLVGTRTLLPDLLTEQLRRTGLTHIVAVSGYNLTILVRFSRRLGSRFSKRLAAMLAVGLVVQFITITGASPSVSRASAVTALSLAAWYYGRKTSPVMLLLFSSALTAMINPLYLWGDLGWWLSFLAFFGILIVAPLLRARIFGEKKLHWLPEIMIETFSAQLMTIPLIMVIFGELSVISLLANLIVLPLVPMAMLLTFVAGIAGMTVPAVAGWISWPAKLILGFMTETISVLSLPVWAFIEANLDVITGTSIYAAIAVFSFVAYRTLRRKGRPVFAQSVIE